MKRIYLLLLFSAIVSVINAQTDRKVVVLDLSDRNAETNLSRIWSAIHIADQAGFSYDTTDNLNTAFNYPVIIFATRVQASTFNASEKQQIKDYVNAGGNVIISSLRDEDLFDLAGVSNATSNNELYKLTWKTDEHPELFYQINDTLETTISLGRESSGPTFFTRYYTLDGGTALAHYENDSVAAIYNEYGLGTCYTIGADFREVIYRNQIDSDVSAHRTYSNGFEPTSDVICFLVKNIVRKYIPNSIVKYTIPSNAKSVVMVTHDIDSRTAMDTMQAFSEYEMNNGVPGQYNITTRYFNDALMSNFYVGTSALINDVINDGHTIASHSVGHFPDFADDAIFPFGTLGNTFANYHPSHSGGVTTGGTVLGELEVSKDLIELDHGVLIRSFRAGHLAYPDSLGEGLELTGYEFNSTHSANNVLTGFPFYIPKKQSFTTTMTTVLEIPMTISDVFSSDGINAGNYSEKVDVWLEATQKYHDNNSPINLLIHPNRMYKLQAQMDYINNIPVGCIPYSFEKYGEFWRKRDSLKFHSVLENDTLRIFFENDSWTTDHSFVLDDNGLESIEFFNMNGTEVDFNTEPWVNGQTLYYSGSPINNIEESDLLDAKIEVFPNPFTNTFTVNYPFSNSTVQLYNLEGKLLLERMVNGNEFTVDMNTLNQTKGVYYLLVRTADKLESVKLIRK